MDTNGTTHETRPNGTLDAFMRDIDPTPVPAKPQKKLGRKPRKPGKTAQPVPAVKCNGPVVRQRALFLLTALADLNAGERDEVLKMAARISKCY